MFWWGLIIGGLVVLLALSVAQAIQSGQQYPVIKEKILATLAGSKEMSGRELQSVLRNQGYALSGPRFYQVMAQLEDEQCVEAWGKQNIIDGAQTSSRWYRLRK